MQKGAEEELGKKVVAVLIAGLHDASSAVQLAAVDGLATLVTAILEPVSSVCASRGEKMSLKELAAQGTNDGNKGQHGLLSDVHDGLSAIRTENIEDAALRSKILRLKDEVRHARSDSRAPGRGRN